MQVIGKSCFEIKNTIYFSENNRYSKSKNRDSMALIQCMDAKKHRIFGDLATDYCRQLTSCFAKAHTVADVFDRYDVKQTPSSRLKESVVPK